MPERGVILMKIFLKSKYTGRQILEAFGKCQTALQNSLLTDNVGYQLVPIKGDFEGISIGPMEIIQGQGAQLVPKIRVYEKKYLIFGPKEGRWVQTSDLKVHLKSIFPEKEYEAVNIIFFGAERNDDGDLKEVMICFGDRLFEKYKPSIGIFLGALADNLKGG